MVQVVDNFQLLLLSEEKGSIDFPTADGVKFLCVVPLTETDDITVPACISGQESLNISRGSLLIVDPKKRKLSFPISQFKRFIVSVYLTGPPS